MATRQITLTPQQSRAVRAWMNWTQERFATLAGVSLSTVRDFERGRRQPIANNLTAMCRVFEDHGIRLLFDRDRAVGFTCNSDNLSNNDHSMT